MKKAARINRRVFPSMVDRVRAGPARRNFSLTELQADVIHTGLSVLNLDSCILKKDEKRELKILVKMFKGDLDL